MANFYKDYLTVLRTDLTWDTKKYIRETLFDYSRLRNGYFHKDNIHDWTVIDKIRNSSICVMFLLLGAQTLSDQDKVSLGFTDIEETSDFYRLCEYVNYHSNELFFTTNAEGNEKIFISCIDSHAVTDIQGHTWYSGVYLKDFADKSKRYRVTAQSVPCEMWLGKLVFSNSESIKVEPVKVKKVFENGKFVGPIVSQEGHFEY